MFQFLQRRLLRPRILRPRALTQLLVVGLFCTCLPVVFGQNTAPLDAEQQAILREFRRFEENLLKSAESTRRTDPSRADLLQRARGLSIEQRISAEMERIASMLGGDNAKFGAAVDQQNEVIKSLEAVLKLLQTENERDRLEDEKARIEELLKHTDRLIAKQRDIRADTNRGQSLERITGDQEELAEDAGDLAEKIDKHDRSKGEEKSQRGGEPQRGKPDGEANPEKSDQPDKNSDESSNDDPSEKDPKSQDGEKPKSDEPKDGDPKPSNPKDPTDADPAGEEKTTPSEQNPDESKPGGKPQQRPSDQKPQQNGEPQGGSPKDPPPESDPKEKTPGSEELKNARQQMQQAIEELEKKKRESAGEAQDEAVAELERLKAKLEEILRQLREEEEEILLALLESRFQQMLQLQLRVNASTKRLNKTPEDERVGTFFNSTTQLSRDQGDIVLEGVKTLRLLQEEGSSAAFPEAVDQMIGSMRQVVKRLQASDVGNTTQLIEEMIVESLEEMIVALQKELEKKSDEDQQKQDGDQQGGEKEQSLVDRIAELKLIRSLQAGVNRMTEQFDAALAEEGAGELSDDDRDFLLDLARRQQRIQKITYDLATKRID